MCSPEGSTVNSVINVTQMRRESRVWGMSVVRLPNLFPVRIPKQYKYRKLKKRRSHKWKNNTRQSVARCILSSSSSALQVNPLNPELNPICYLLALLRAHHFLYVSRIRIKLLTFRLLMLYIYIHIYIYIYI